MTNFTEVFYNTVTDLLQALKRYSSFCYIIEITNFGYQLYSKKKRELKRGKILLKNGRKRMVGLKLLEKSSKDNRNGKEFIEESAIAFIYNRNMDF